jgi:hypothetical protein
MAMTTARAENAEAWAKTDLARAEAAEAQLKKYRRLFGWLEKLPSLPSFR